MKAKTVAQHCILKWIDNNFYPGSLHIQFVGKAEAIITDANKERARVIYEDREVYLTDV